MGDKGIRHPHPSQGEMDLPFVLIFQRPAAIPVSFSFQPFQGWEDLVLARDFEVGKTFQNAKEIISVAIRVGESSKAMVRIFKKQFF